MEKQAPLFTLSSDSSIDFANKFRDILLESIFKLVQKIGNGKNIYYTGALDSDGERGSDPIYAYDYDYESNMDVHILSCYGNASGGMEQNLQTNDRVEYTMYSLDIFGLATLHDSLNLHPEMWSLEDNDPFSEENFNGED